MTHKLQPDRGMHPVNVLTMHNKLKDAERLIKIGESQTGLRHVTSSVELRMALDITAEVKTFMASWLGLPQENGNNDEDNQETKDVD